MSYTNMPKRKSKPTKQQGALALHKDCYFGPHENKIKWQEAPNSVNPLECNHCGLPIIEGQVFGLVPLELITGKDPFGMASGVTP